ncbi:MAG: NAD(P)H-hydrate dehydratase [Weeksellaceae bacterium]|nr:NAD(P)H-hydrate dehydratase [Weeksellaceae bacterium]
MKILTTDQIRDCDAATVAKGISSANLMEKAARSCVDWLEIHFRSTQKFLIFCGNGNNGGDGMAMARMLYEKGFDTEVYIDKSRKEWSHGAQINLKKLKQLSGIAIKDFSDFSTIRNDKTVIVDAIFGFGLSRKLSEEIANLIQKLNQLDIPKIAIDVPSGLFADQMVDENATVFEADSTLTFQFYKRSFFHPENGKFCGNITVLDIDLDADFIESVGTNYLVIDEDLIKMIYKPRNDFSNKGTYGKSVLVGGTYGKIGAILMSGLAALKTGSGLTFVIAPDCGNFILQSQIPEAMFINSGEKYLEKIEIIADAAYGVGPGLGKERHTQKALVDFLKNYDLPVVLDADALNILADSNKIKLIPKYSVITPHPLEFERLFGSSQNSFARLELAKRKAEELQLFIVLKDHHTAIITPDQKVFYNITGNAGMAKGGSGDVLTGIITSLISQKYDIEKACIFGVWLHGKAGELASEAYSKESMLPTDLIQKIGEVFKYLSR